MADNPNAFPACNEANVNGTMGMTLRDWFAGQALPSVIRQCAGDTAARKDGPEVHFARKAYELADAMLEARADIAAATGDAK